MVRQIIIGFLFSASFTTAIAQSHIYLSKIGKEWRVRYYTGDKIKFKLDKSEQFSFGTIQGFTDSSFIVSNTPIKIRDVAVIDIAGKSTGTWNFHSLPSKIMIAGIAYPLISMINSRGNLDTGPAITGASMIAGGLIARLLINTNFKIGDKKRATIIYKPDEDVLIAERQRNAIKIR
jgi:hypothetical protein